jgi:glycosyltransferase involved in cell wall biosynthesis
VAAVIPAYDRADLLPRAIASVRAQTSPPAELIVVDDCSTDATARVAEDLGVTLMAHDRNRGESAARNTAIAAATQPWVALLDSDDEWRPDHLDHLFGICHGHALVSSATLGRGPGAADDRIYGVPGPGPLPLDSPAAVAVINCVPPSSAMLDRQAAIAAGGFDEELPLCADLDMWLRVLERGTGIASPRVGSIYHLHEGQVSRDSSAMRAAHLSVVAAYSDRDWCSQRLIRRCEGALEWDALRDAISARDPGGAARSAKRILMSPSRAAGVAGVVGGRRRLRARTRAAAAEVSA